MGAIALWPEGVNPCLYRKLSKKSGISSFSAPFYSIEFLISHFGKGNPEYSCLYLLHVVGTFHMSSSSLLVCLEQ